MPPPPSHRWLLRQFLHFLAGAPAFLLLWYPAWQVAAAVAAAAFVASAIYPHTQTLGIYRPSETRISGAFWYAAGVTAALLIFPREAAFVGWLILASGDSAATVFGTLIPIRKFGRRSLGGAIGFVAVAAAVTCGATYVSRFGYTPNYPIPIFAAVLAAALAEAFCTRVNDNLLIPSAAAAAYLLVA